MTLIEDRIDIAGESGVVPTPAPGLIAPLDLDPFRPPAGFTPLGEIVARSQVAVCATVASCEVAAWAGGTTLEVTLEDPTGALVLAFLGRTRVGGIHEGSHLMAAGRVVLHQRRAVLMNPYYWLVAEPSGSA